MARRPFLSLTILLAAAGIVNAAVGALSTSKVGDEVPTCSVCGPLGCEVRTPGAESAVDEP